LAAAGGLVVADGGEALPDEPGGLAAGVEQAAAKSAIPRHRSMAVRVTLATRREPARRFEVVTEVTMRRDAMMKAVSAGGSSVRGKISSRCRSL